MGKTPNKHLSKEDTQMAKKYIKACSMQLFIKKVQIKTTLNPPLLGPGPEQRPGLQESACELVLLSMGDMALIKMLPEMLLELE